MVAPSTFTHKGACSVLFGVPPQTQLTFRYSLVLILLTVLAEYFFADYSQLSSDFLKPLVIAFAENGQQWSCCGQVKEWLMKKTNINELK